MRFGILHWQVIVFDPTIQVTIKGMYRWWPEEIISSINRGHRSTWWMEGMLDDT
jgi:hypothetical protein